ncbi:hypothetical protein JTB14_026601 [Gonioctena quinquepunctata]|nr:hypothetical protein JTB14_026601 [Gonioctena quinquepunctata]
MYVRIFTSIGRLPQLLKYYLKCQKDILLKKWRNQLEFEQDESTLQWIHNYYNELLSNWYTQYRWFNQVFTGESASHALIDIYSDVLSSLDPSLNECIDAALKQFLDIINQTTQAKPIQDEVFKLQKFIFSHLVMYINKYASYEQTNLMKQLSSLNCMKEELPETIQALGLSIPSVIDLCRQAKKRCQEITENCGYCGLLVALRSFLLGYADFYRVALRQIDRSKKSEDDWNIFQLSMSLLQNTGEVILQLQQLEKDLTFEVLNLNKKKNLQYKILLLEPSDLREFDSLVKCVTEGTRLSLLDSVMTEFQKLCADIYHTTYQVLFTPISEHLEVVHSAETWSQFDNSTMYNSDLPDYSFSPQEYITQIGQYLMILPQHLEPFLFKENPSLSCALRAAEQEYINVSDGDGALAHIFLTVVARGTSQVFCDRILSICELRQDAGRQLAHDISE